MHKSFNKFALAGAAMALAMTPAIAGAQEQTTPEASTDTAPSTDPMTTPPATPAGETPTAPQGQTPADPAGQTPTAPEGETPTPDTAASAGDTVTNLPADKQAAVQTWPTATQEYYKSLSAERQKMFWALSDSDKVRLSQLPEAQRETAWAQIEAQIKTNQG